MSKVISRFVVVSVLLISTSLIAAAQETVPFTLTESLSMKVRAKAGGIEGDFLVDLGAGNDVLSPTMSSRLSSTPAGYYTGFHMGGERMDGELRHVDSLQLGSLTTHPNVVGIVSFLDEVHLNGLLSAKMFENQPVTFDFVHRQITFESARSLATREKKGASVPLNLARDRGITLDVFAKFDLGNGQVGECLIDTGLTSISVNERFMKLLGVSKDAPNVQKLSVKSIAGGERTLYKTTLPSVSLAGHKELAIQTPDVYFSNIIYDCVVGNRFWIDKAFTLDLPLHRLLVTTEKQ